MSKHVKRSNTLIGRTLQKFLVTTSILLSAKKVYKKNKYEDFALEILEEKVISLRGQQVKPIGVPGVFYSEESSELKTGKLKATMEMFLSSVVDTLNFEFLREKIV